MQSRLLASLLQPKFGLGCLLLHFSSQSDLCKVGLSYYLSIYDFAYNMQQLLFSAGNAVLFLTSANRSALIPSLMAVLESSLSNLRFTEFVFDLF